MKNFTLAILLLCTAALGLQAQTTIYTQTFSSAAAFTNGWSSVDNTGTGAGVWSRVTTAGPLFTTRSNGYANFNSDAMGNDGKPEDASITSKAINCTGHDYVAIEFQSLFGQYNASEGKLFVSNDSINWTEVYSVNSSSPVNPEIIRLDITSVAAGNSTVYLRFNYTGNYDLSWSIDDIKVYEPATLDVAVNKIDNDRFVGLSDQTIIGTITNNGTTVLNSVTLSYTDNAGTPVSQTITGLSLALFQTYNFSLTNKVIMSTPSLHALIVTSSAPNGGTDLVSTNNSVSKEITALSAIPEKNVLFEEFTTCQCGWCPAGHYISSQIQATAPYFIPVNLHAGFGTDGMTTTEATLLANAFANGAPTATIDRVQYAGEEKVAISRNIWESKATERHAQITPATIDAVSTYEPTTRALSVTLTAKFYGPVNGNFRVNCYVIEDSVTGTGSGFDQHNYLSGQSAFASYPTYSKPDPIPGYQHRHVDRQVLGTNGWGSIGVVPSTTTDGGSYNKTYTTTLNSAWKAERCKLVALVHEYNASTNSGKNEVFNVVELPLGGSVTQTSTPSVYSGTNTGLGEVVNTLGQVSLYPNPVVDIATLEFNLTGESKIGYDVTDLLGQVIFSVPQINLSKGGFKSEINTSNFSNGLYLVSVKNNGKVAQTLKFTVSK